MLTSEQMQRILSDEVNGKEPTIHGEEADQFREDLKPDLKLAKEKGWIIEIPGEWEVGEE